MHTYLWGSGTSNDPYIIWDYDDLNGMRDHLTSYFKLGQDLDLAGETWVSITSFNGDLDGDGYTIDNFTSTSQGLFGNPISGSFSVYNLTMSNVSIISTSSTFGAIASGNNTGSTFDITNCHVSGTITSSGSNIGGLTGQMNNPCKVFDCTCSATISGGFNVGGIVGGVLGTGPEIKRCVFSGSVTATSTDNVGGIMGSFSSVGGELEDSYSIGFVTCTSGNRAGGLVGGVFGTANSINRCYSSGIVSGGTSNRGLVGIDTGTASGAISSYWDTDVNVGSSSPLGLGRTTNQLEDPANFVGWDFLNVWSMTGIFYPTLDYVEVADRTITQGAGIQSDPRQISNLAQLNDIRNYGVSYYILTADIDASRLYGINNGAGWDPIDNWSGFFDGDGYTINGFYINRPSSVNVSMFGGTTSGSPDHFISNVNFTNLDITGSNHVATFTSDWAGNEAEYKNIHLLSGSITSTYTGTAGRVGGLCSEYTVPGGVLYVADNCSVNLTISYLSTSSSGRIGGLFGAFNQRAIRRCSFTGTINGGSTVFAAGGLAGSSQSGAIWQDCYSAGTISNDRHVGGLFGFVGGITVQRCYSASNISGGTVGGFFAGQLIGDNTGSTATDVFGDSTLFATMVGNGSTTGYTGQTTAQMQMPATYTNYDFLNVWKMTQAEYPTLDFVEVADRTITEGSGTLVDPYIIYNYTQLTTMTASDNSYTLGGDIDASRSYAEDWNSHSNIVSASGGDATFDGANYTIDGLNLTDASPSASETFGFFKRINPSTNTYTVKDLTFTNLNYDIGFDSNLNVGGIAGNMESGAGFIIIENCRVEGTIEIGRGAMGGICGRTDGSTGTNGVKLTKCSANVTLVTGTSLCTGGGLCGAIEETEIEYCYSEGTNGADNVAGGLIGGSVTNQNIISNSYSLMDITNASQAGGFIGNQAVGLADFFNRCWAAGSVTGTSAGGFVGVHGNASYTQCKWDTTATGQGSAAGSGSPGGIIGHTTTEMQQPLNNTWSNFDRETIWSWTAAGTYPTLDVLDTAFDGGTGTPGDPYLISNFAQLMEVTLNNTRFGQSYKLTANIDASRSWGCNWQGSGLSNFNGFPVLGNGLGVNYTGIFDGNGYAISNLKWHVESGSFGGSRICALFTTIGSGGIIRNLSVLDSLVTIPSFPSLLHPDISGIADAAVTGSIIENCRATLEYIGDTDSNTSLAGISDIGTGTFTNCWAILKYPQASPPNAGGIVRGSGGTIVNCFHDTEIGIDVDTYQGNTDGQLTTLEMLSPNNFTSWDIQDGPGGDAWFKEANENLIPNPFLGLSISGLASAGTKSILDTDVYILRGSPESITYSWNDTASGSQHYEYRTSAVGSWVNNGTTPNVTLPISAGSIYFAIRRCEGVSCGVEEIHQFTARSRTIKVNGIADFDKQVGVLETEKVIGTTAIT